MRKRVAFLSVIVGVAGLFFVPSTAYAYLGPGGVLTAVGALLALFVALVAAIVGFLWYPLKRLRLWLRSLSKGGETVESVSSEATKVG